MLLLAIDTATSAIAVALYDGSVRAAVAVIQPRRHTEELAPAIARVLSGSGVTPADLSDIAVGTGPGPFTGLRVGLVTAVTMGHALRIPVHGVCSLDALAQTYVDGGGAGDFVVATDARRKEVYWATYAAAHGGVLRRRDPAVDRPSELPDDVRCRPAVGRGARLYPGALPHAVGPLDVDGGSLARLAATLIAAGRPLPVTPLYLRRPDAVAPGAPGPTVLPTPGGGR